MPPQTTLIALLLLFAAAAAAYQLRSSRKTEALLAREPEAPEVEVGRGRRLLPVVVLAGVAAILLAMSRQASILLATSATMAALTELMSNLATVEMILPLLSEAARTLGIDPRSLLLPATLAASCAFMLPVATAPNAIVYGSGKVKLRDMLRAGLWLNVLGLVLITLCMTFLPVV